MTGTMRKLLLLLTSLLASTAAQATQKTPAQISSEIITSLPDNISNLITPLRVRSVTTDIVNSFSPYFVASTAPGNPVLYQQWFDISETPLTVRQWDGSQWIATGTINATTHLFTPSLAPGQAVSNLGYTPLNAAGGTVGPLNAQNITGAKISLLDGGFAPSAPLDIQGDVTAKGIATPAIQMAIQEHQANGYIGAAFTCLRQAGGGGPLRNCFSSEQIADGAVDGEQIVGAQMTGHIRAGGGTAYGANPYAWVDAAADAGSQVAGTEIDTDARRDVAGKTGLQIVDVATSIGKGTILDNALDFSTQHGGIGWPIGINFGYGNTADDMSFPIKTGGVLVTTVPSARQLRSFIDLSNMALPATDCGICLPSGDSIKFGGAAAGGGSYVSATLTNGPRILNGNGIFLVDIPGVGELINLTQAQARIDAPVLSSGYTETLTTPASGTATCTAGQFTDDANFHYVCTATNAWKKSTLRPFASLTVATLPTCAAALEGAIYPISDATTPTYNGALTGGGAIHIPAYCNGTAWTAH